MASGLLGPALKLYRPAIIHRNAAEPSAKPDFSAKPIVAKIMPVAQTVVFPFGKIGDVGKNGPGQRDGWCIEHGNRQGEGQHAPNLSWLQPIKGESSQASTEKADHADRLLAKGSGKRGGEQNYDDDRESIQHLNDAVSHVGSFVRDGGIGRHIGAVAMNDIADELEDAARRRGIGRSLGPVRWNVLTKS